MSQNSLLRNGPNSGTQVTITLLNEQFLQTHPEFQQLHASLVARVIRDRNGLVWAGIGCGLASIAGILLLGGIPSLAASGVLCVAEVFGLVANALETSYLYQIARTFRYFGVERPLETFERTMSLGSRARLEWAFAMAAIGFAAYDISSAIGMVRQLRMGHAAWYEISPLHADTLGGSTEPTFLDNNILTHFRARLAEERLPGRPRWDMLGYEFDSLRVPDGFGSLISYYEWLVARLERAALVPSAWGYVPDVLWTPRELMALTQLHRGVVPGLTRVLPMHMGSASIQHAYIPKPAGALVPDAFRRKYARRFYDLTLGYGSSPPMDAIFPISGTENAPQLLREVLVGFEREANIVRGVPGAHPNQRYIRFGDEGSVDVLPEEELLYQGHMWFDSPDGPIAVNAASGGIVYMQPLDRWEMTHTSMLLNGGDVGGAHLHGRTRQIITTPLADTLVVFPWGQERIVYTPLGLVQAWFPPLR